jgi:beta-lactamase class A
MQNYGALYLFTIKWNTDRFLNIFLIIIINNSSMGHIDWVKPEIFYKKLKFSILPILFIIFIFIVYGYNKNTSVSSNSRADLKLKLCNFISTKTHTVKHISIYFYSFKTAKEIKINDTYKYYPASLEKVPIMIAYLKIAQSYPTILQYPLSYTLNDSKPYKQNIVLGKNIYYNKKYTVDELIQKMIEFSDNKATNVLFDHLNTRIITNVFTDLGIKNPEVNNINYLISVSDYAKFFKALYKEDYLNKGMSQKAMHYLIESKYRNGLVAGVPSSVPVAEKFGERIFYKPEKISQFHECGIFYTHDPYLLCVMTDGNNIYQQSDIVKDISQLVYSEINKSNNTDFLGVALQPYNN